MENRIDTWKIRPLLAFAALLTTLLFVAGSAHGAEEDLGSVAWRAGDHGRAVHHWRQAAAKGDHRAEFLLSNAYQRGQGVAADEQQAAELLRDSAAGGFPPAQFNLGNAYFHGTGVEQNFPAAIMWWRRAAEQDMVEAQFNLGFAYYRGAGVPRDVGEATHWFRQAASGGSLPAATILDEIESTQRVSYGEIDDDAAAGGNDQATAPADADVAMQETPLEASPSPSSAVIVSGEPRTSSMASSNRAAVAESSPNIASAPSPAMPRPATAPANAPTIDTLGDSDYIVESEEADESVALAGSAGIGGGAIATNQAAESVSQSVPGPPAATQAIPRRTYHPNALMTDRQMPAPRAAEHRPAATPPAPQPPLQTPPPQRQQAQPATPPPTSPAPRQAERAPSAIQGLGWYRQQPADRYTIQVFGSKDRQEAEAFARDIAKRYPIVGLFPWDNRGVVWHGVSIGDYASLAEAQAARAQLPLEAWNHPGWPRTFEEIQRTLVAP